MPKYGPNFKALRRVFNPHRRLYACEVCGAPAACIHHIVRPPDKFHDEPHFWIVVCGFCHMWTNSCLQPFERARFGEAWRREYGEEAPACLMGARKEGKG